MKKGFIKISAVLFAATFILSVVAFAADKGTAQASKNIKGADIQMPVREKFDMAERMAAMGFTPGGGMPGAAGGAPGGASGGAAGGPGGAGGAPGGAPGGAASGPGGPGGAGGPGGGGSSATPAVYIDNGKHAADKSKKDAVTAGTITDTYATGVKITGKESGVGGVYVKGIGSEYILSDATINLSGAGSGLGGTGTGAISDDHSTLILKNCKITTDGRARGASAATNYSTLKVYNSTLTAHGEPFTAGSGGPPAALEIDGNARTHVTMSNSYSYFYYSTIEADGWAALSTDGAEGFVYLEANNCKVKTTKSGYGTYADGSCHNYFNYCDFDVASMAAIIAGEADCTFNNTVSKCGTYFAMIHCVMGDPAEVSALNVTGGEITCKSPAVIVKSQNAIINFDGVKISAASGVLVKAIVNDDANATKTNGKKVYGIHTRFRGMDVAGDIIDEDTDRDIYVYLEGTSLKGAIKDSIVKIDRTSKWTATKDSKVTIIGDLNIGQIDAPAGVTITATAGEAGTFTLASGGTLVLKKS